MCNNIIVDESILNYIFRWFKINKQAKKHSKKLTNFY